MKILAVRGRNLASLPAFDLRLDAPPLAQAGLFAIVGRTGAGKSTLLDAICLALYGETPRLSVAPKTPIVRDDLDDTVRVDDPRTLLRRGATEAVAEVEFLDRMGTRCLARWRVRRARNRPDGAVQKVEMSLTDLGTGVTVADNISTARAEILRRVGLNFGQFRRTVLLAQGDFAAFLRAESGERAQLLEHVTGKAIYGRIGRRAHELARDARNRLELVRAEVRGQICLGPEEREAAERAAETTGAALAAARARVERARIDVAWHDHQEALAAAFQAGRKDLAAAAEALAAGAETRAWLARVDAAAALRPAVARAAEQLELARRARESVGARTRERDTAAKAHAHAAEAATLARRAAGEAEVERARRAPDLVRARGLDVALREAARAATEAAAEHEEAARREQRDRDALVAAGSALAESAAAGARHRTWLDANGPLRGLVTEWARWRRELERFAEAREAAAAAEAALPGREAAREGARNALAGAETAHGHALARVAVARAACEEAESAAPGPEALARARDEAARLHALANVLERLVAESRRLAQEAVTAGARAGQAAAAAEAAEAARRDAAAEIDRIAPTLAEARRARDALLARRDLHAHRAELRAGEPCPLCGSPDHPFATGLSALAEVLEDARLRVEGLATRLTEAERRAAAAVAEAGGHRRTIEEARGQRERSAQALAECGRLAREAGCEAAPETDEGAATLVRAREDAGSAERLLRSAEDRAARHAAQVRELRAELDAATAEERAAAESTAAAARALDVAVRAAAEGVALAADARGRMELALREVRAALNPLAGWEARLHEEPRAIVEAGDTAARDWATHREGLDRCVADAAVARERVAALDASVGALSETSARRAQLRERADAEVTRLDGERRAVLEGEDADIVEKRLMAMLERTARESREREEMHAASLASSAAAQAALDAADEAARQAEADAGEAEGARDSAVRSAGFTLGQVEELLAHDEGAVLEARAGQIRVAEEHARAAAVAQEREARLAAHAGTRRDVPERARAEAALREAAAEVEEIEPRAQEAQFRVLADERAREALQALRPRLEAAQAQVDRWAPLDDLIGSADGRVFREFAQGLTLEALLAHANEHLGRLAPRYRLARVRGHDLEMQVIDAWSADEVRGIPSLSGGETFLVSLALALGLASLSSGEVATGSLFIDEGFGTLDSESLNLALDVLEQLQASGRQVGIISHVGGLADRIEVQVRVTPVNGGASQVAVVRG